MYFLGEHVLIDALNSFRPGKTVGQSLVIFDRVVIALRLAVLASVG